MIRVPLTRGYEAKIDKSFRLLATAYRWHAIGRDGAVYAARKQRVAGKLITIYMHREIAEAGAGQEVDHINGDRLDNRRSNLRLCSHRENGRNVRTPTHNRSGFRGVAVRPNGRFDALIVIDGRQRYLGRFKSAIEAACAYDTAAAANFGAFARLNFGDAQ